MKFNFLLALLAAFVVSLAACDETSTVGNILDNESVVIVVDSNFTVTGHSVDNPVVQSRTISQLLGAVEAPVYGSINSDFVAQFMPSTVMDTTGVTPENIDSLKLFVQLNSGDFVGDSLVPMGMEVYRLNRDLPHPIYSNFDPSDYYSKSDLLARGTYNASLMNEPDSVKKYGIVAVSLHLPVSLGRELFNAYKANPDIYSDPEAFTKDVFKGIYVNSYYGTGRISDFTTTSIRMYYHKSVYNEDSLRYETKYYVGDYFAVTPEVVVNNNIHYTPAAELKQMIAEGDHILAAPAGYEVELKLPGRELVQSYNQYKNNLRVLNTLTLQIPADSIANPYAIAPPPYALLVLKNKKDEFFAANTTVDNETSFYATYSSTTNSYTFGGLRGYMEHLLSLDEITDDDLTFIMTPCQLVQEQSASSGSYYYGTTMITTAVVPYVSKPAMARISLKDAKLKLTFSAANTGAVKK